MPMPKAVRLEKRDAVWLLIIDQPEKMNALGFAGNDEITALW